MPPKICYLSRDPSGYSAALYQNDFLNALRAASDVVLVSNREQFEVVNKKESFDLYLFGHQWLNEEGEPAFHFNPQDLGGSQSIFFLNKEYANLESKLDYVDNLQPTSLLTHHHDLQNLTRRNISANILWIPFAGNPEVFQPTNSRKKYDLNFSGVLRNPSFPETQTDDREVIQDALFHSFKGNLISKRGEFKDLNIYWKPVTGNKYTDLWNRLNQMHWSKSKDSYAKRVSLSIATLNTLSPLGLVGTRYFECALSKSLILTPQQADLQGLFEDSQVVRFEVSKKGLGAALDFARGDSPEVKNIVDAAHNHALRNHTWEKRVLSLLEFLTKEK